MNFEDCQRKRNRYSFEEENQGITGHFEEMSGGKTKIHSEPL